MEDTLRSRKDGSVAEHGSLARRERVALSLHRGLDRWLSPIGVWIMRRTQGGVARRWDVDALLLTTLGRRSGRDRTVVLQYFRDGDDLIVVAANDGGSSYPGWYHNLVSTPGARVEVEGLSIPVRAEELHGQEAEAWWMRILEVAPDYARYRRATTRPFPIMRLSREGTSPNGGT
jgi:deazaflavin-dependent oxidoreductase (nitroreductase family)